MNEQVLIGRACMGDQAAFAGLVEKYQSAVYNLCYRMLGDVSEAEDATQETFLRTYSQLGRYDLSRPFKTWLLSIASHYCIDRLRRRRVIWVGIDDEPILTHPALRESKPGPEQQALHSEQSAAIEASLAQLPPKDRSAIVMRYWYDFSYEEIALATGVTASAIKSRLHRARLALGQMLQTAEHEAALYTRTGAQASRVAGREPRRAAGPVPILRSQVAPAM